MKALPHHAGLAALTALCFTALIAPRATAQVRLTAAHRDLELVADDDVKVRSLKVPPQFDDKGKPRKPTAEELKALKGPDRKLPGYTLDYADLKPGQIVRLSLSRRKTAKPSDKETDAKKDSGASGKSPWVSVGEVTGVLSKVSNPTAEGGKKKQAQAADAAKRLTVRLDYAAVAGKGRQRPKPAGGKLTLGEDVFVSMIVVLADEPAGK
jgi:hypothetical protein